MSPQNLKSLLVNARVVMNEFYDQYDQALPYHGKVRFVQNLNLWMELDESRQYRIGNETQSIEMDQEITWQEIGSHCVTLGLISQQELNDALAL